VSLIDIQAEYGTGSLTIGKIANIFIEWTNVSNLLE
jgi:hypothetical protein